MKTKFYQEKGFFLTLLTSILVISIALITEYKKTLFVQETGTIKIIGSLGVLLAIGLLLKWKYARQILGVIVLIGIVGIIFIMTGISKEFLLSYSILLTTLVLIAYFLFLSRSVRNYVSNK
jgi:hypothetical protein